DRKSTRLNSSHSQISYAVFCLKKKIEVAGHIYRGMFNLPISWKDAFGPLAWLGVRFDGPPAVLDQLLLVIWLVVWLVVAWFFPNTQQLLARWHPAYNYGLAERDRDP